MPQDKVIDSDFTGRRMLSFPRRHAFWLLISAILCGCTTAGSIRSPKDRVGLKVTLTLNKQSFLVAEPIYPSVVLENTGTDSVTCMRRYEDPLIVKDSYGKVYQYHGPRPALVSEPPAVRPGETVTEALGELLSVYGVLPQLEGPHARILLRGSIPRGIYTARAIYVILRPSAISRQTVRSDAVGFVVAQPLGEEKRAHELLEEGLECTYKRKWVEAVSAFKTLVERYPGSAYAVLALEITSATQAVPLGDKKAAHETRKRLIIGYPESPRALHHVRAIPVHYINEKIYDEQLVRDELRGIGEATRGTQIEKEVKEMLKEFDAGTSLYHEFIQREKKLRGR